jgi:hypothetical protein
LKSCSREDIEDLMYSVSMILFKNSIKMAMV